MRRFERIVPGLALAAAGNRAAADVAPRPFRPARPHAPLPDSRRGTARARPSAMTEPGAMTCAHLHDVAAELALGALTGRERAAALAHLDQCRTCREDVHRLMTVGGWVLELIPPARPPTGFETRVLHRLAEGLAADNPFRPRPRRAECRPRPRLRWTKTPRGAGLRAALPVRTGGGGEPVTDPARRLPLALLAITAAAAAVAACSAPAGETSATAPPSSASAGSSPAAAPSPTPSSVSASIAAADRMAAADSTTTLVVPAGEGAGVLSTPRQLTVPSGWTARVWARVDDARMEAWTPEGDLLVSSTGDGSVMELRPDPAGTATVSTLLSGLTNPQGLAFARLDGRWVLYVAESDQIDRYPWGPGGISGARTVIAGGLPDQDPNGDDVHRPKDVAVAADGTVYFNVGSSSNATPDDRTMTPPRAVIMSVRPDGTDLQVVERGVRNGEGLAVAPNGTVWTAVNERDNIPYPSHRAFGTYGDAFGQVIQAYVNEHPPDEVVPVTVGRDLGWPYCDPDQDDSTPAESLADVPLVANATTNPNGTALDCASLAPIEVGLPAHSAPLGMSFLEGSKLPAPWSGGAVIAVHGSWDRHPPRAPAVEWLAWNAPEGTLTPAVTLVGGFELPNGSYWGRPADAVPGPDGSLYVSDDSAGAIYRLTPPA